jgi:hypothetical protein
VTKLVQDLNNPFFFKTVTGRAEKRLAVADSATSQRAS